MDDEVLSRDNDLAWGFSDSLQGRSPGGMSPACFPSPENKHDEEEVFG